MQRRAYNQGTPEERFVARVLKSDGCWEWQGYRFLRRGRTTGYGKFGLSPSQTVQAHRFAYELWVGPIPAGHVVHHICENLACVRPDHLEAVADGKHQADHAQRRGAVKNQYGEWPVAISESERLDREREMAKLRARRKSIERGTARPHHWDL